MDSVMPALHYLLNWIRFLEITSFVMNNEKFDIFNKLKIDFN